MGMHVGGARGGPRAEINVTPLVDVVLVLLIIFMVLTPLLIRELELAIPRKAEAMPPPAAAEPQVVLRFARDRTVTLNDEPVALGRLGPRLRDLYAARRDKVLFLDADDDANYGEAVRVMDVCREAGVATIGLVTRE